MAPGSSSRIPQTSATTPASRARRCSSAPIRAHSVEAPGDQAPRETTATSRVSAASSAVRTSSIERREAATGAESTIRGVGSAQTWPPACAPRRSEEHTSELQSRGHLVCRLLLEKKKENEENQRDKHP